MAAFHTLIEKIIDNPKRYPNYVLINDIWYRLDRQHGVRIYVPKEARISRQSRVLGTTVVVQQHVYVSTYFWNSMNLGFWVCIKV